MKPSDERNFANPTCGASARLVDLYISNVCDLVWFAFLLLFLLLPAIYDRCVRYGSCSFFIDIFG